MYIERVPNRNSRPAILIRSSHWDHGKIRKVTHANLSKLPDDLVNAIALLLRGGTVVGAGSPAIRILDSRPFGHVAALLVCARKLGLPNLLHTRTSRSRNLALAPHPPASAPSWHVPRCREQARPRGRVRRPQRRPSTWVHVSEQHVRDTLEWLARRQPAIEAKLARRHLLGRGPALCRLHLR